MTITEHKRLIAAIPEDLMYGEDIEVCRDGVNWHTHSFKCWDDGQIRAGSLLWRYARRPAAAQKKRLKDEPWPKDEKWQWRYVNPNGLSIYFTNQPVMNGLRGALQHDMIKAHNESWVEGEGYDATDWQNSLERRPT